MAHEAIRDLLEARLEDALTKSEKGSVASIPFLTPRDAKRAERMLTFRGARESAWFWGGYPGAERVSLFLLPDYLTACLEQPPCACDPAAVSELLGDELSGSVGAVLICGSGYRTLSHRDYLGSILALGLERDAVGDIALQDDRSAVVFCPARLADFLIENLTRVASDAVRCRHYTPDESFTDGRRYRPITATVASPRLDCVVAALTDLSREEAQAAVRGGLVEVDFEPTERTDLPLTPPTTLSIRGYGRYILRAFGGETRKGRLRINADQLV